MLRQFMRPMGMSRAAFSRAAIARTYASKSTGFPQLTGLDGTYATALYHAAEKDSSPEATEKALLNLKNIFTEDPKSEQILVDPSLDGNSKSAVIEELVKAAKGDKVLKGFLETLASFNRLNLVSDIIKQYEVITTFKKGIVEATVTSAAALDSKSLKRVEKAVQGSSFAKGRTLQLTNIVDPNIRGGLIVNIGDRTADLSVASKLLKYNTLLQESI